MKFKQQGIRKKPQYRFARGGVPGEEYDPTSLFNIGQSTENVAKGPTLGNPFGMAAGIASGVSSSISPQKSNQDFMSRGFGDSLTKENKAEQARAKLEGVAANFGPVGAAVAGVSAVGRAVDNATKDEFGIYRSKGAMALDKVLDPVGNIQDLVTADWKNFSFKNAVRGDAFGEQDARRKERDQYFNNLQAEQITANEALGAKLRASTPVYQAPAYGRYGMKFKSRFAKRALSY